MAPASFEMAGPWGTWSLDTAEILATATFRDLKLSVFVAWDPGPVTGFCRSAKQQFK